MKDTAAKPNSKGSTDEAVARDNWDRFRYVMARGHTDYCRTARRCEDMYLGGGRQWLPEDKAFLQSQKRPAYEFNEIKPGVNSAIGYQIHNRMDVVFLPANGEASDENATALSKLTMQIFRNNQFHWKETGVFSDGLIEQRGYYDIRMDFDENIRGEIKICTLDPMDVIPDPDATEYDPDTWADVTVTRWMTLDQIEAWYGKDKRDAVEAAEIPDDAFGEDDETGVARSKFGMATATAYEARYRDGNTDRYRVVDRQYWVYELTKVAVFLTGDVRVIETATPEAIAAYQQQGAMITRRMHKRVKWTVSTESVVLFHDYSTYKHFTIVPYFCYFRRGQTVGMVDDAIGPQEALNKGVSQFVHIINTTANSGWKVKQNSLKNMSTEDLEERGAETGLVLELDDVGSAEKITANNVPQGVAEMTAMAQQAVRQATTPEAMRGENGPERSGVAIQSAQFASQQQLAVAMDNLNYTRRLVVIRVLDLIQSFMDDYRIIRITDNDPLTGAERTKPLEINKPLVSGEILHNLTIGEYDMAINEVPMQVTFQNSQFTQALEMRKEGIALPDKYVIKYSNLSDKADILEEMANQNQSDPLTEAKVANENAKTEKLIAETVAKSVEATFSAIQTAATIAQTPATAPLADKLLRSAGFQDKDAAPIVPEPAAPVAGAAEGLPTNTNPLTPANPGVGINRGIETPAIEEAAQ